MRARQGRSARAVAAAGAGLLLLALVAVGTGRQAVPGGALAEKGQDAAARPAAAAAALTPADEERMRSEIDSTRKKIVVEQASDACPARLLRLRACCWPPRLPQRAGAAVWPSLTPRYGGAGQGLEA